MTPEIMTALSEGKKAYQQADFDTARDCFVRVLRSHPEWSEMYGKLGVIYHHQGRFTDAVKLYAHALKLNPQYLEARLNLAVLLNDMGRYEHAAKVLEPLRTAGAFPGRLNMSRLADSHIATGDAYFDLQLYEHARAEYENAARLRPAWPDLKKKLGVCLRRLGRHAEAIRELEGAVAIDPRDPNLPTELALCFYQSGQVKRAVDIWNGVLEKAPDQEPAAGYLALALNGKRDIAAA